MAVAEVWRFLVCALLVVACADPEGGQLVLDGTSLTTNEDTAVDHALNHAVDATQPTHGTVSINGLVLTYTPDRDFFGTDHFTIYAEDGEPPSTEAEVAVTVLPIDDAPVAHSDQFAASEDAPFVASFDMLLANDEEVDGDTLTITAVTGAANGVATLESSRVRFVPATNFVGVGSFDYTISDGRSTSTANVTLSVGGVNDAPIANDDSITMTEDVAEVIPIATLLANDSDLEGQTLVITGFANPINCIVVSDTVVQPTPNFNGTASFEYLVSDGAATSTGLVTIDVTAVNDPPQLQTDLRPLLEDHSINISLSGLLANDSDVDGDTLMLIGAGNPWGGTLTIDGDIATFTPPPNFYGNAGFEYYVSDGTVTQVGIVGVPVTSVNDAPIANDDTASTYEEGGVAIPILANDIDIDGPSSLSIASVDNIVGGTVSTYSQSVTFHPAYNFFGTASFRYTVTDGDLSDTAVVTIAVAPTDDPPEAVWDIVYATEDTPVQIPVADVLANDREPDGDPLVVTEVSTNSNGASGSVSLSNGIITFTPAPNATLSQYFDYKISDGTTEVSSYVNVDVTAVEDPPVARDDARTTTVDTPLVIMASSLAGNDLDVDGDWLQTIAVDNPVHGTVSLANGVVTFTPEVGYTGTATFEYTVSDSQLTDIGLVTVTVTP